MGYFQVRYDSRVVIYDRCVVLILVNLEKNIVLHPIMLEKSKMTNNKKRPTFEMIVMQPPRSFWPRPHLTSAICVTNEKFDIWKVAKILTASTTFRGSRGGYRISIWNRFKCHKISFSLSFESNSFSNCFFLSLSHTPTHPHSLLSIYLSLTHTHSLSLTHYSSEYHFLKQRTQSEAKWELPLLTVDYFIPRYLYQLPFAF